jgi:hypothetical protein
MPRPKPEDLIGGFKLTPCLIRLRRPIYNLVEATLERVSTPSNEVSRDALIEAALVVLPRDVETLRDLLEEVGDRTRVIDIAWSRGERPDYREVAEILDERERQPGRPRRSGRENPDTKRLVPGQLPALEAVREAIKDRYAK